MPAEWPQAFPGQKSAGYDVRDGKEWEAGMTLRDYFAAAALQGLMACGAEMRFGDAADWCFRQADAMLEARSK